MKKTINFFGYSGTPASSPITDRFARTASAVTLSLALALTVLGLALPVAAVEPTVSDTGTLVPSISGETISSDISNFEVVSQGLWRGAQPSHQAINKLAQSGVKTIIDLRYAGSGCSDEAQVAKTLGINYVNIPLGFEHPSMINIARFLAIVAKPANQPVFVHCRQGADRTGTLVGIFRIMHDHWTFTEAYNEMRLHHFKPWLANMKGLVARCEGNTKLSKELTEMANKLQEADDSPRAKVSLKTTAQAIY
ncbi:MAG: tyrosine-protein phosphatase [Cyanobacteria bacterium REEB67]|nr:tyrosine-protein phosphatase [Cyanobacteria bacterium REEB67]